MKRWQGSRPEGGERRSQVDMERGCSREQGQQVLRWPVCACSRNSKEDSVGERELREGCRKESENSRPGSSKTR